MSATTPTQGDRTGAGATPQPGAVPPCAPRHALTAQQARLLAFIEAQALHGVSPSYDEMCAHIELASKSSIHRLVIALEERGHIRRLPNRARTITVVAQSDPVQTAVAALRKALTGEAAPFAAIAFALSALEAAR